MWGDDKTAILGNRRGRVRKRVRALCTAETNGDAWLPVSKVNTVCFTLVTPGFMRNGD